MNLPCKEKKCILYPICLNKTEIRCDDLRLFLRFLSKHENMWEILNTYFPKLQLLTSWDNKSGSFRYPYDSTKGKQDP